MSSADVRDRLLAPVRVLAKSGRHARMRLKRATKQLPTRAASAVLMRQRDRVAAMLSTVHLPVHRLRSEARACPACGGTDLALLEPVPLYQPVDGSRVGFGTGCRACGLLFVNPLLDLEKLAEFYSPEGEWGVKHARDRRDGLERQAARARAGIRKSNPPKRSRDFLLEAIAEYVPIYEPPPGASVLDFGCGDGKLLNVLMETGWRTYGIEPSSDVAFLRHTRLEHIPPAPQFDFVVLHHVLEHMPSPLELLRALAGAMKPGAALFISVPRLDTLPEHRDFRYCLNARTHPVSFSEACLRELLARAGLALEASLSTPALDRHLTDGVPLRMRVVARKSDSLPRRGVDPLRAAIDALRRYRSAAGGRGWLDRMLPVRTQAFLRDREQRRPRRSAVPAA
jgi:2-polyprenyl-3-methyl-5-hydroxy-6-metoxy-1,4-benzoquinol methylase